MCLSHLASLHTSCSAQCTQQELHTADQSSAAALAQDDERLDRLVASAVHNGYQPGGTMGDTVQEAPAGVFVRAEVYRSSQRVRNGSWSGPGVCFEVLALWFVAVSFRA